MRGLTGRLKRTLPFSLESKINPTRPILKTGKRLALHSRALNLSWPPSLGTPYNPVEARRVAELYAAGAFD